MKTEKRKVIGTTVLEWEAVSDMMRTEVKKDHSKSQHDYIQIPVIKEEDKCKE